MTGAFLISAVKKQTHKHHVTAKKKKVSVLIFVNSLIRLLGTSLLPGYFAAVNESLLSVASTYHNKHNLSFQNKGLLKYLCC